MKRILMAAAAALGLVAGQAHAQGFSDTSVGVRDGWSISNPGAPTVAARDVNKIIVNVGHFDVWDYGTNFFNVDALFSNANEPAYAIGNGSSGGGSTEFYAVYRAQLSPDKILGVNTKFGPFTAINFEIGGDAEAENTQFAPDKKLLVAGPNFNIGLPAGFLNIGVHVSKEWNNNGYCANACTVPGGAISFHATPEFEFVWLYSLKGLTGLPIDFKGFLNVVLPKGKTGFGVETVTEVLARPTVSLDIGTLLFNKPHKPDIYFAVELWENKFGNDHTKTSGSEEVAPEFGIEMHF
jgi:nucleoside-specific outer membrane channel protein Tsx